MGLERTMSDDKTISMRFARPSQRRHHRLTAPLWITADGATYKALDWSVEGLRFRPAEPAGFKCGDRIDLGLSIPFQGFNVALDVQARVVRTDSSAGDVALQLVDVAPRAKALLEYFSVNLMRGEMASIEGTIKCLDLPVTPPPPKAPAVFEPGPAQARRHVRSWLWGSSYILFGVALTIGLLYTLYVNVFFVPSEKALLYAPTADLIAPEDGTVSVIFVREGERVAEGDPLLQIKSPQFERLLSEARIKVREAEVAQERLSALIETEDTALETYRRIASDQVVGSQARLAAAQEELRLLEHQHERVLSLSNQKMVSTQDLERVQTDQHRARESVLEAQAELRIARAAQEAAQAGKYFTSNRLEGRLPELKTELVAAQAQIDLAKTRLTELERQADQLTLRAPGPGYVRRIPVAAGNAIAGGTLAISLLTDQAPQVYALLASDQLDQIALGAVAHVFVPALSREVEAKVVAVEPRLWALPDDLQRLFGEASDGGLAVLDISPGELETASLQPGLPVLVELRNEAARHSVQQVAGVLDLIAPDAAYGASADTPLYSRLPTDVDAP
jgi:HlyD family secretion protein